MIKLIISLVILSSSIYAQVRPANQNGTALHLTYRHFQSLGNNRFNLLIELDQGKRFYGHTYNSLKVGGYYRLTPSWRIGPFLQTTNNLRHNNDWISTAGQWTWRDKSHIYENIISLVSLHRWELIPKQLLFEFRHEWHDNFYNGQQIYKFRPGFIYFISQQGRPLYQFYLLNEYYRPLNFNQQKMYERWFYLGMLYHYSEQWKIGPEVSYGTHLWRTSDTFQNRWPTASYLNQSQEFKIGLNIQSHY